MGLLVAFGALAGVMSWISGPSRGLLWTAQEGVLPCFLQKTNKNGVQVNILVIQGCIVTLLSSLYIVMDDVSVAFFLLSALTVGLYLVMYMMMYAAGIRLRYTQPGLTRSYRVLGGNAGMWAVGGIGFLAVLFSFIVTFFPAVAAARRQPGHLHVAGSRRHARLPLHAVHHQLRNGSQGRHEYPGHREIATGTPGSHGTAGAGDAYPCGSVFFSRHLPACRCGMSASLPWLSPRLRNIAQRHAPVPSKTQR